MLERDLAPLKNPDAIWRSIDGEVVVFLPRNKENKSPIIRIFNDTASKIWESIDGNAGIKEIAEIISEEFSVTSEKAFSDIKEFLHCLKNVNLILLQDNEAKKN